MSAKVLIVVVFKGFFGDVFVMGLVTFLVFIYLLL